MQGFTFSLALIPTLSITCEVPGLKNKARFWDQHGGSGGLFFPLLGPKMFISENNNTKLELSIWHGTAQPLPRHRGAFKQEPSVRQSTRWRLHEVPGRPGPTVCSHAALVPGRFPQGGSACTGHAQIPELEPVELL